MTTVFKKNTHTFKSIYVRVHIHTTYKQTIMPAAAEPPTEEARAITEAGTSSPNC